MRLLSTNMKAFLGMAAIAGAITAGAITIAPWASASTMYVSESFDSAATGELVGSGILTQNFTPFQFVADATWDVKAAWDNAPEDSLPAVTVQDLGQGNKRILHTGEGDGELDFVQTGLPSFDASNVPVTIQFDVEVTVFDSEKRAWYVYVGKETNNMYSYRMRFQAREGKTSFQLNYFSEPDEGGETVIDAGDAPPVGTYRVLVTFTPNGGFTDVTYQLINLDTLADFIAPATVTLVDGLASGATFDSVKFRCHTNPLFGFDNLYVWYGDADTTPPTVASVEVTGARTIEVTFDEALLNGVYDPANFVLSGSGQGSLNANPDSITHLSGNTYQLTWDGGEMGSGDVTVTVSGVSDVIGNAIQGGNSGTDAVEATELPLSASVMGVFLALTGLAMMARSRKA